MTEDVFFNPGDAIANAHDFSAAERSAEIFKQRHTLQSPLVIVENAQSKESFAVYFEKDAQEKADDQAAVIHYHVRRRLHPDA